MIEKLEKPIPPPGRDICEACGKLENGKHTNWLCRLIGLLTKRK